MTNASLRFGSAALALIATPLLWACAPRVASMTCDAIGEQAKTISQAQAVKITALTGLRETARTETDARCEGQATLSDNSSGTLYLRAYEESGNTMVAYQGTPFP